MYPPELIKIPILAGCPEFVCKVCGIPTEKINLLHADEESKSCSALSDLFVSCDCWAGYEPGIVLDPFMGSGTTAVVASRLRRYFIGIEIKPDYINMAKRRLQQLQVEAGHGSKII